MADRHYNLEYLQSISGGDQDFVQDMILTFISDVPNELIKLRKLVIEENWQRVGEDAHKFASSLLFLGLDELKLIAVEIEESGLSRNRLDHIPLLLDQLDKGCAQIIAELKRDYNV
jgi:HPt (histidine-containing phosphotransfer) domain-containing protein